MFAVTLHDKRQTGVVMDFIHPLLSSFSSDIKVKSVQNVTNAMSYCLKLCFYCLVSFVRPSGLQTETFYIFRKWIKLFF